MNKKLPPTMATTAIARMRSLLRVAETVGGH